MLLYKASRAVQFSAMTAKKGVRIVKQGLCIAIIVVLLLLMVGCTMQKNDHESGVDPPSGQNEQEGTMSNSLESVVTEETESNPDEAENRITPYQFLNLFLGNADQFSFGYRIYLHETKQTQSGTFQKTGEDAVARFTTQDMNGNCVTVREMEADGFVHYIMDDARVIKTYLAPAEDYLINELMLVAKTTPSSVVLKDGYDQYEYSLPFEQDHAIHQNYVFFMQDGILKKMTYSVDGFLTRTYEFSEVKQETIDPTAFSYPEGYREEVFEYQFTGEHMPPWWEFGNDE